VLHLVDPLLLQSCCSLVLHPLDPLNGGDRGGFSVPRTGLFVVEWWVVE